jgi:5-methylcytosine-specific restriction endonuclease McrA
MTRSINEWIGKTGDDSIPPRVRLRVFERYHGTCQHCLRKLYPGDKWQCDHTIALVNGGAHRESNLRPLCHWCHAEKTKQDVAEKSASYRKRKRNTGIRKPRSITRWRRFDGSIVEATRER